MVAVKEFTATYLPFTIASTAGFTMDALAVGDPTAAIVATAGVTYTSVGTVAATPSSGVTYSLIGAQAAGFTVQSTTGEIRLDIDFLMLDTGVLNGWTNTRVFTLRATNGAGHRDCTVTITLDTSAYSIDIPGVDYATGRTSTNPLKSTIAADAAGLGWTITAATSTTPQKIAPNTNNPTALVDYDLRGYSVGNTTFTGASASQCLMDGSCMNLVTKPIGSTAVILGSSSATMAIDHITIDCQGRTYPYFINALSGRFSVAEYIAVIAASNDVCNANEGEFRYCYGTVALSNNRNSADNGATINPNGSTWGHSDGWQCFGITGNVYIHHCYIDDRYRGYDPIIGSIRRPSGTAALGNGSTSVVGTGTSWLTTATVGEAIMFGVGTDANPFVITAVNNDLSLTVGSAAGSAYADQAYAFVTSPCTGVTAPVYFQGPTGTAGLSFDLNNTLIASFNILRGGTYTTEAPLFSRTPAGTITVTSGSTAITGAGTSWLSGSTTNKILANEAIMVSGQTAPIFVSGSPSDNTHATITANASFNAAGLAYRAGSFAFAITQYDHNIFETGVFGYIYGNYRLPLAVYSNTDLRTGAALTGSNQINPFPNTPVVTAGKTGATYLTLVFAIQSGLTVADYEYRFCVHAGVFGAWGAIPSLNQVTGLSASTSYDYQVRGKNCLSDDGVTYLQVGTAGALTASTNAGTSYQAETTTLLATFSGSPTEARKDAIDDYIIAMKTAAGGNLWTKLDFLHVFANIDADAATHDWVAPGTFDITVVGSPTFVANSYYQGVAGTNYLKWGYKGPFTGGLKALQNDNSLGFFRLDNAAANQNAIGNARLTLGARQFAANTTSRNGASSTETSPACTRSDGLFVNTRRASNQYEVHGNGTTSAPTGSETSLLGTPAITSGAHVDSEMISLAYNTATGSITVSQNSGGHYAMQFGGSGFTLANSQDMSLATYNYLHAIGAI